ncbi:MAG: hypothetical protein HZB61_10920 [Nitrospirae bacterium]|nr:hypothetical protein [Nitrospirota bacterium]
MPDPINICSLDYLTGTLATAYKGLITSLVVKDFCITEENNSAVVKGAILSMPAGEYHASLMHEGAELAREKVRDGYFELRTDSATVREVKNLQIDIIQRGRHIGTFLLKSDKKGDFFVPAVDLSRELSGVNFKSLTSFLQENTGLLRNAEGLVSKILSSKKDWTRLSEDINSFSKDIFWTSKDAHAAWFRVLVRYAIKACENTGAAASYKPVSNLLSLIELPLENGPGLQRLRSLTDIWLDELKGKSLSLSCQFRQTVRIIKAIHEKFPDAEIGPVLRSIINSVKDRLSETPVISNEMFNAMKGLLTGDDLHLLFKYGTSNSENILRELSVSEEMLEKKNHAGVLDKLGSLELSLLNDTVMVDELFSVIEPRLNEQSSEKLSGVISELFPFLKRLSADAHNKALKNIAGLLKKLIGLNMTELCETLMARIETFPASREDIFLDPEVARSMLSAGGGRLLKMYKDILKKTVIPSSRVTGFSTDTWTEMVDPQHLLRLSKFLRIISLDSGRFRDVLVHVICNLHISGVFIPDDKLFQREVSTYMNADGFMNNFLLNYMLLKKLPVYFNEVGATGRIRDYTTEIDSWGNDQVLYFLRKQVHANASNYNIRLVEGIISAWVYDDPELMKGSVPEDVIQRLDRRLSAEYSSAIRPLFESSGILDKEGLHFDRLFLIDEDDLRSKLNTKNIRDEIHLKIFLLCKIYRELCKKYSSASTHIEIPDVNRALSEDIEKMEGLMEIIGAVEKTLPVESLFFKRHIAFGIPSVMGSFHEAKFDAFSGLLRIEERLRTIIEGIITDADRGKESLSSDKAIERVRCLEYAERIFRLHGLSNFQVDELVTILKTNKMRVSQVIDSLRMWQKELAWMVDSLHRTFHGPLLGILKILPESDLPEYLKVLTENKDDFADKAADIIFRDIMSSITGFLELDRLLDSLLTSLNLMLQSGSDPVLSFSEGEVLSADFYVVSGLSEADAMRLAPAIGGKMKNLVYLYHKGIPVPPAVVFPAAWTQNCLEQTEDADFESTLRLAVKEIESRSCLTFGGDKTPLFLSVRSGSYISMPGILSSILYCGMNRKTVEAFIMERGNALLAWDSYRRSIEDFATVVYRIEMKFFDDITAGFMRSRGGPSGPDASDMEKLCAIYSAELAKVGIKIPDDVYEQLKQSVKAIYASWYSERSVQFRKVMNVSDYWGTSVALMQMVYGNEAGAGASVFFTRNPFSLEKGIHGDTREAATGSDIVYGKFTNRPLAKGQAMEGIRSLEEIDNALFMQHNELAEKIEEAMGGLPQEVEVTYTKNPDGRRVLHVLQTRRMETHRGFTKTFHDVCDMGSKIIGRGAGVHGGALSGFAVFSVQPGSIERLKKELNLPAILLREMASTDDVSLMPYIDGIITAAGGVASHASVLAQKFGLTAVVGCSIMEFITNESGETYAVLGDNTVKEGTHISLDGSTGLVYSGLCLPVL